MVRLRGLKHPLLHGSYLKQRQALERRVRQEGGKLPSSAADALHPKGGGVAGGGGAGSRRMLGTRRETMMADMGLAAAPVEGAGKAAEALADGEPTAQVRGRAAGGRWDRVRGRVIQWGLLSLGVHPCSGHLPPA